ncbi:hypothetical protein Ab1vBOLIVR5_gp26 [Agrobacterium phage OLIVR5]|uniref:Uncharacterized protein n=1 Tax=Agrobacterium phage OLIVR5 TaxID=2723773 RepID=A0A858MSC0_9CAUD|nr:hypothetical protein KNU99_gp026 [Agrobacterium phage OLIVR5]QIW87674.1 hypothetical protein Ab1vBOLIVR5_gp26 [Agrobacterium phage OLIVR5]QIW87933.1 hypothetical protein Ab1vBOLIVR6_gp26 [Agrobacterium phage OLIVR6]
MLDRQIRKRMEEAGASPQELQEHFERCAGQYKNYMYGKKGGPTREFIFDAMSLRAWVYAISKAFAPHDKIDIARTIYIGTVTSPAQQKKKVAAIGKIAAQEIERFRSLGHTFGLRTDVATCINYETDNHGKGLKRRLLKKNYPDIDAKIIMNQYFSPFPDYIFHLMESFDPDVHSIETIRVVESEIVNEEEKDEWAVEAVKKIISRFQERDIYPHHPQYVEHGLSGLNFTITLVNDFDGIKISDVGATINKTYD